MRGKGKKAISLLLSTAMCCSAMTPAVWASPSGEPQKLVYDISFEEQNTGSLNFGEDNDQKKRGQTFVAVEGGNIRSIDVSIGRVPGTEGDVTAELYEFDMEKMEPTGDLLASATVPREEVAEFDLQTETGLGVVTIPLEYEGLTEGQMYILELGQESLVGGYRWSASSDISNPNWWHDDVWNPQVSQKGYDGELPSLKFTKDGQLVDESRCGDYWMKVNYSKIYTYDLSFEEQDRKTGSLNFGESGDQFMRGQTFMAVEGGDLKEIEVSLGRTEQVQGDVRAELYEFDPDANDVTGGCLASAVLSKEQVTAFDMQTETGVGHVRIPLEYEGLTKGQMYIVKLGQKDVTTTNAYRWSASSDVTNPNWWHEDVWNPQVSQKGYGDELPSLKFGRGGEVTDESRCGDLWLKVYYESAYAQEESEEPDPEPDPDYSHDGPGMNLEERYLEDMGNGGESFYMDRILTRPGIDPSLIEDSGIMTRGGALYTKGTNSSGLIKEFGFGGIMRYVKGDQPGYTIRINGQRAEEFTEETSRRADHPSYWSSAYRGKPNSENAGLQVVLKRFITEHNVAVTVMELRNTTQSEKTVSLDVLTDNKFGVLSDQALGGEIYADGRSIEVNLTADGGTVKDGILNSQLVIPPQETVSYKVQMGFTDPNSEAAVEEYTAYQGYTPEEAFTTHVQTYNKWWVENIPYMEVPDESIQKMIAYRWWIARFNMADMSSRNYPFPTSMEGVFGYNNAIINAIPWQLDEMRYLRSPLAGYGTWFTAAMQANGGIYVDNRAGLWSETPQHYISQAGWENYKVHGGQTSFLKAMADAGAGDVIGTQNKYDRDKNYLYDIQYDAWDADTVSLAYPDPNFPGDRHYSAAQERIDTAAFAWMNAEAVSEMYRAVGDDSQAESYRTFSDHVRDALLANNWDRDSRQFLMKFKGEDKFNPLRDINNYYVFMAELVPQGQGYDEALRVWGDENEFPMWPMYISNSKDYVTASNSPELNGRSRNYSPGSMAITLKMFGSAIKNYDADNISGEEYADLLKNYTNMSYCYGNTNYPDVNEFFNNPDGDVPENGHYRSWIHHNWHSQYNTLIIEDVMGMTPREDQVIELNPIDLGWDSFSLENISYHDSDVTVKWNEGEGYELYVDCVKVAAVDRLAHFTWDAKTGKVTVLDDSGAVILTENKGGDFKNASDITYEEGRVAEIMKAAAAYMPGDIIIEDDEYPYQAGEKPAYEKEYVVYAPDWEANAELAFGNNSSGDEYKRSQEFAALEDGTMTGIQVMIRRKGATKDATVELYTSGADNLPGERLAYATIPKDSVRSDYMTEVNVPLECELEAGKTYYVVLGQEEGGENDYAWVISSKHTGNLQTIVQGKQAGYDGDLRLVKIQAGGKCVDESQLGDHYLKVYYNPSQEEPTPKPDKSGLRELVGEAKTTDYDAYTEESVKDLKDALEFANGILEDEEATETQIAEAIEKLQTALDQLEKKQGNTEDPTDPEDPENPADKPDKSGLKALVDKAGKIDYALYTKETGKALKEALTLARKVLDDEDATEEQIKDAGKKLDQALKGLEKLKTEKPEKPDNNDKKGSGSVKTGDETVIWYPVTLLGIAGLMLVTLTVVRRRRKYNK